MKFRLLSRFAPAPASLLAVLALFSTPETAAAQTYFEDESPRSQELRTHPGIRSTGAPDVRPERPWPPQAFRPLMGTIGRFRRSMTSSAAPSADSSPTTTTAGTAASGALTDFERLRAQRDAENTLRPALESAIRGAEMLGLAAPVNADGSPLFASETKIDEDAVQARRLNEGTQKLLQVADQAREKAHLFLHKPQGGDSAESSDTVSSPTMSTAPTTGPGELQSQSASPSTSGE